MSPPPDTDLRDALEGVLAADRVRMDSETRHAYSTDASPCVVEPRAVVFPVSEADVVATLRVCAALGVPVTPRASGTSLSGAAIGPGVVLDTSRLNRILQVDKGRGLVRVEPGVLLAELNDHLAIQGLRFATDPGSMDLCRIGGMLGHNASGYSSVKYGQTRDHVVSLRVVLADGMAIEARDLPVGSPAWDELRDLTPAFESIRLDVEGHRAAIQASRRPIRKWSCGYDVIAIADSLEAGVFPLPSLFVGSEGTLGIITEATLQVLPLASRRITVAIRLRRLEDLGPISQEILRLGPSAIEAMDGGTLALVNPEAGASSPSVGAMLLVQFDDGDLEAIARVLTVDIASKYALAVESEVATEPKDQAALWKARRSVFPMIIQRPGRRRAWGFVEDPVVPPDRVPEFIEFLVDLARRHDTEAGIYGHLGDGNTHYRPFFDPGDPEDFERMVSLREEFDEALIGRFRGAPSGEHGIGRIRADVLLKFWGAEVYGVMRRIKRALDPDGLLNPAVLFSSDPWWTTWGGLESRSPM